MSDTNENVELDVPFPLEVIIQATAVSDQTKNRKGRADWIKAVRHGVQERLNFLVEWYSIQDRPLMATIYYFPPSQMDGDVDNIVKPILDGMIGVAYKNDRYIEKVVVQKFEPGTAWVFSAPTSTLASAIEIEKPALYIRLDKHLDWRTVGWEQMSRK
jgi:crossover junction endodeoxyribonuclease RusA